jgi:hypothetical protein
VVCPSDWGIAEQLLDQAIARDDPVRAQEQKREQSTLPRPANPRRPTLDPHLEGAQDSELDAVSGHAAPRSLPEAGALAKGVTRV